MPVPPGASCQECAGTPHREATEPVTIPAAQTREVTQRRNLPLVFPPWLALFLLLLTFKKYFTVHL